MKVFWVPKKGIVIHKLAEQTDYIDHYSSSYSSPFSRRPIAISKYVTGEVTLTVSGQLLEYSSNLTYDPDKPAIQYQHDLIYSVFEKLLFGTQPLYTDWWGEDLGPISIKDD